MDRQKFFDEGVCHVFRQGKPGVVAGITSIKCQYRTADGLKCFVGGLIPDARYTRALETKPLGEVLRDSDLDIEHEFARRCQSAHDSAAIDEHHGMRFLPAFAWRIGSVASDFGLDTFALRNCLARTGKV